MFPVDTDGIFTTKTPRVKLITEDIGDLLTPKKCWHWLELHHAKPNREEWSLTEAERCYSIMLTLLQRQFEYDEDIWYEPYFKHFGVMYV